MTIARLPVCLVRTFSVLALLFALFLVTSAQAPAPAKYDSGTISGLTARNIGSATMGGRIAAIDAVDENGKITVFVGSASGGVWKSINGATTFRPVFDREPAQSIGAVSIDPSNHKIVWVGTGESWTRNSVSIGNGIYKSTDGGENWSNMGLKDSEHIARILVDPKDSKTVYACATGHLWNDNDERGVYKTTDGGTNWKKVLAGANGSTGCAMLATNTQEPKTIYASMWDFRRQGWTFRSGGPGSGCRRPAGRGPSFSPSTSYSRFRSSRWLRGFGGWGAGGADENSQISHGSALPCSAAFPDINIARDRSALLGGQSRQL